MGLHTTFGAENIPEGAVRLSQKEALAYQKTVVRDWKNETDVLFLRYGRHFACGAVLLTSAFTWSHFKSAFNLGNKGNFIMSVPGTLVPVVCTWFFFNNLVTDRVMVMKSSCPLCIELTCVSLQLTQGLIYPGLIGIVGGAGLASHYKTSYVPDVQKESKQLLKFFSSLITPKAFKFQAMATFHLLFALLVPYLQSKELFNVMRKLEETNNNEDLGRY